MVQPGVLPLLFEETLFEARELTTKLAPPNQCVPLAVPVEVRRRALSCWNR